MGWLASKSVIIYSPSCHSKIVFCFNWFELILSIHRKSLGPKQHWTPLTFIVWMKRIKEASSCMFHRKKKVMHVWAMCVNDGVNDDRIVIFGWTIPLSVTHFCKCLYSNLAYLMIKQVTKLSIHFIILALIMFDKCS